MDNRILITLLLLLLAGVASADFIIGDDPTFPGNMTAGGKITANDFYGIGYWDNLSGVPSTFPNTSLINYLLISTYGTDFPNASLSDYLPIATYSGDFPNSTIVSKEATWDGKTTLDEVNSSAQITESQVTNLVSDLAGKESTITGSTNNAFWNGLKQWIVLGIGNITGLQTELDDKLPIATYSGNFPNSTIVDNLANWNATYNVTYDAHTSSNGSDHTFIDQDVTSGSSPAFDGINIIGFITNTTVDINVSNATGTLDEARIDSDIARDSELHAENHDINGSTHTGSLNWNKIISVQLDLQNNVTGLVQDANVASASTWNAKTTLDIVNSSAQISRSQVTGQITVDDTQNSSISTIENSYVTNITVRPYSVEAVNLTGTINYSVIPALPQSNVSGLSTVLNGLQSNDTAHDSDIDSLQSNDTSYVASISGLQGNDTTHDSQIISLQANDTYFNGSVYPNSTNFKNDSLQSQIDGKESTISAGVANQFYAWNKSWQNITTSWITEGTNLFYTSARAISALSGINSVQNSSISTLQSNDTTHDSQISSLQVNDTTDRGYVNDTFLKLDGTSAMTGNLNQGGNYLVNSASVNALNAKGAGYWFDGDDYVSVPDSPSLKVGTEDFSTIVGFKTDTYANLAILSYKGVAGKYHSIGIYHTGEHIGQAYAAFDDGGASVSELWSNTVVSNDEINIIVVTADRDGNATMYVNGVQDGTLLDISSVGNLSTNGILSIGGVSSANNLNGNIYYVYQFNRLLSTTEVKALSSGAPVDFADIGADNVNQSSGTLEVDKRYRIVDFIAGDNFTNVGGTNEDGNEFIATGTTPTTWTNSSVLKRIGAVLQLEEDGITDSTWYDRSGNGNDGTVYGAIPTNQEITPVLIPGSDGLIEVQGNLTPDVNNTYDIGAVGLNYNRIWATTFAGGEFVDKAPSGYDYTTLWSWDYFSEPINASNLSEGYNNWSEPNIPNDLYYSAVTLNTTTGNWDLVNQFGTINSVAIIPNDDDLIADNRLVILGGYKARVYGTIQIGDKLISSNRAGVLTNARDIAVPSLQYVSGSWQYVNLPATNDPDLYNIYDSAQGVAATVVAIALEDYNSNNTGIIEVKVMNT